MEPALNIDGIFASQEELVQMVRRRRICYDIEPYNRITKQGDLLQIGYQINLYGTFAGPEAPASSDDPDFYKVLQDVRKLAGSLLHSCDSLHMCEDSFEDGTSLSYSQARKMRPDVTVHIPVFDRQQFGHPVDSRITATVHQAAKLLEAVGVHKISWPE